MTDPMQAPTSGAPDATITPTPTPQKYVCGQWDTNCNNRAWPPMHTQACADRNAQAAVAPTPTERDRFAVYTPGGGKWQVIERKADMGGEEFFVSIADARDRFEARRIAAAMNAKERAR